MRTLHWFRKDLRIHDNTALLEAFRAAGGPVAVCYISEPAVLRRADMSPARGAFALECLRSLDADIARKGGKLIVRHGKATEEIVKIATELRAEAVYWNEEYEPQLRKRDEEARLALEKAGFKVRVYHDRLLVPPGAVATKEERPYTVFTHFERACQAIELKEALPGIVKFMNPTGVASLPWARPEKLGFQHDIKIPEAGEANAKKRLIAFCEKKIVNYATARDFVDCDGTSRLSADLKFGTLSPRTIVSVLKDATGGAVTVKVSLAKFINELRWRDFYAHILYQFPRVETQPFKPDCAKIVWEKNERHFEAWRDGKTGYPIVDAAMRQLHATGWMHNRARMIVASFFTKDLGLDWRLGERVFMNLLIDGDLASNNGGWQWAASTGTDAAPYFRIFNPILQSRKFDKDAKYIKTWIPELAELDAEHAHAPWEAPPIVLGGAGVRLGVNYPKPVVDHAGARERSLARFEKARS